MNDAALRCLTAALRPDADAPQDRQAYWLLDGARDPAIAGLVRASGLAYACLFAGQLHPRLQAAAPYLVHLSDSSPASAQLLARGWGKAWGILVVAGRSVTLDELRLHFKKFLRVQTEQGKTLAFRYYDPRVLNVFLPTCTVEELRNFLGPVSRLIAESDDGGVHAHEFELRDGAMRLRRWPLDDDIEIT